MDDEGNTIGKIAEDISCWTDVSVSSSGKYYAIIREPITNEIYGSTCVFDTYEIKLENNLSEIPGKSR